MVLDRATGAIAHRRFAELPRAPARGRPPRPQRRARAPGAALRPRRGRAGSSRSFSSRRRTPRRARWHALAKPGRRAKTGARIALRGRASTPRSSDVADDGSAQRAPSTARSTTRCSTGSGALLFRPTSVARPGPSTGPRTARPTRRSSLASRSPSRRRRRGSTSPQEILSAVRARGVEIADLTLSVGAGTFKPVTVRRHRRSRAPAGRGRHPGRDPRGDRPRAKAEGRRVVAVGTTVARSLEAAARLTGVPPDGRPALRDGPLHHARLPVPRGRRPADELPPARARPS